ncbi:hypothetical protein MHBO_001623, partial [Bonamia ostreae]
QDRLIIKDSENKKIPIREVVQPGQYSVQGRKYFDLILLDQERLSITTETVQCNENGTWSPSFESLNACSEYVESNPIANLGHSELFDVCMLIYPDRVNLRKDYCWFRHPENSQILAPVFDGKNYFGEGPVIGKCLKGYTLKDSLNDFFILNCKDQVAEEVKCAKKNETSVFVEAYFLDANYATQFAFTFALSGISSSFLYKMIRKIVS